MGVASVQLDRGWNLPFYTLLEAFSALGKSLASAYKPNQKSKAAVLNGHILFEVGPFLKFAHIIIFC